MGAVNQLYLKRHSGLLKMLLSIHMWVPTQSLLVSKAALCLSPYYVRHTKGLKTLCLSLIGEYSGNALCTFGVSFKFEMT